MSINPFYYRNIVLQNNGVNVNDLTNDYVLLQKFDLDIGIEPPNKNILDISTISFDINTSYKNTLNLNCRDISNINSINIPGIFINKFKFIFNENINLTKFQILDGYLEPIKFKIIDNVGNSFTPFDISNNVTNEYIINNELIIDFSNNIPIPSNFTYERSTNNNIFKLNNLNIKNNILQEKHGNNFMWDLASWKIISISNEIIPDQELSINKLNEYLKNTVNQQGRTIFSNDKYPIEIYPYNSDLSCVINFRYQGYTETELSGTNLSFIDISTAHILVNDISYKYNLADHIYIDLSSNLFEYLDLNNTTDTRLEQHTATYNNKSAIMLPINQDISINFIFKLSENTQTQLYYGSSLNDYTYMSSYNFSYTIPETDHNNTNLTSDINASSSYTISIGRINILNIDNKNIIYDINNNINMYFDYVNCNTIDISNINVNKIISNTLDISNIDSETIFINKIENGKYIFDTSQNIYSLNSNHNIIDCSSSIFSSNNVDINNTNTDYSNILKKIQFDNSSNINNIVDNSYAYILSYNNKNIINYDNCRNVLNFGISSEGIYNNVNIDIKKVLIFSRAKGSIPSSVDTNYSIVNPYSASITNTIVNNIFVTSDDRIKFDEKDISNGIEIINSLNPKIYLKDGLLESGYIAQEVASIPDISHLVSKFDNIYYINYNAIQPYIVNVVQILHEKLLEQNSTITNLSNEISLYLSETEPEPEPEPEP